MAYASASDVAAIVRNLLGPAQEFDDLSTSPTLSQVTGWLSSGCSVINTRIGAMGYSAVPSDSVAYDMAKQINALFAAWMAERTRTNARVAANERTRADMLKKDFESLLDMLVELDLGVLGVDSLSTHSGPYAGGISIGDKQTVEGDSDRVQPRFSRGQFANPYTLSPTTQTSGS